MNYAAMSGDIYIEYIFKYFPNIDVSVLATLEDIIENTNWDNPQTSLDWNNLAVIDLINADFSTDSTSREYFIQKSKYSLDKGFKLDKNLFCIGHYILIQSMLGDNASNLIEYANANLLNKDNNYPLGNGLVYLPAKRRSYLEIENIINADNSYNQSCMFFAEAIRHSMFILYDTEARDSLKIAAEIFSHNSCVLLMTGVNYLINALHYPSLKEFPQIQYFHQAHLIKKDNPIFLQALYLCYRDLCDFDNAKYWLDYAKDTCIKDADKLNNPEWQWTKLKISEPITYVGFDQDLILTIEPSFRSIVTSVLIGQNDWFEGEMEFWRDTITEGMTVIDVGANAGVYTFSAAKRVGASGLVLAVEPFSKCVTYLHETCKINKLDMVKICHGAASNYSGKAKLLIDISSEANKLIEDGNQDTCNFEEVECFTLDSLIEKYRVQKVDILKIDAEGYELEILQGAYNLLSKFAPVIIYESNKVGDSINIDILDLLRSLDYQLYEYKPFIKKLVISNLTSTLNIIALPNSKNQYYTI